MSIRAWLLGRVLRHRAIGAALLVGVALGLWIGIAGGRGPASPPSPLAPGGVLTPAPRLSDADAAHARAEEARLAIEALTPSAGAERLQRPPPAPTREPRRSRLPQERRSEGPAPPPPAEMEPLAAASLPAPCPSDPSIRRDLSELALRRREVGALREEVAILRDLAAIPRRPGLRRFGWTVGPTGGYDPFRGDSFVGAGLIWGVRLGR